jgi:hypothetical protein
MAEHARQFNLEGTYARVRKEIDERRALPVRRRQPDRSTQFRKTEVDRT